MPERGETFEIAASRSLCPLIIVKYTIFIPGRQVAKALSTDYKYPCGFQK